MVMEIVDVLWGSQGGAGVPCIWPYASWASPQLCGLAGLACVVLFGWLAEALRVEFAGSGA